MTEKEFVDKLEEAIEAKIFDHSRWDSKGNEHWLTRVDEGGDDRCAIIDVVFSGEKFRISVERGLLKVEVSGPSLKAGKKVMEGMTGKVIRGESPYVKLLTDPLYQNGRWEAVAQVDEG